MARTESAIKTAGGSLTDGAGPSMARFAGQPSKNRDQCLS